jgi:hypothetical protein
MTFDLRMFFIGLFGVCFALSSILCVRMSGSTSFNTTVATVAHQISSDAAPATDVVATSVVRNDMAPLPADDSCGEDTLALPERLAFTICVIDASAPLGAVPSPSGLPRIPARRPPDA